MNIHSVAMLTSLNVSQWTARRIDKKASKEVANTHNMVSNKGAYYKSLVEGESLDKIKQLTTKARHAHYRRTLPWSDNGARVLSNLGFMDYATEMADYGNQFEQLVNAFLNEYPMMRQEAKRMLGSLFNDDDYPTLDQVAAKFSFTTNVTPIPVGSDFRCDIGEAAIAKVRAEIEASTNSAVRKSVADAYDRVAAVVEAFIDRLAKPETLFKNSLVENARDLAEVLPSLNFTGDPALDALGQRLKDKLCQHEPDALRHNPQARQQAYETALDMHKDLLNFFGGAQ